MQHWSSFQKGSAPFSLELAQQWLDQVVEVCYMRDQKLMAAMFTDDAVADLGEIVIAGKENLGPFLHHRYSKYIHFELQKKARVVSGDTIVCDARMLWTSAEQPNLQHTRAIEILQVRDGLLARWDNAVITWPASLA